MAQSLTIGLMARSGYGRPPTPVLLHLSKSLAKLLRNVRRYSIARCAQDLADLVPTARRTRARLHERWSCYGWRAQEEPLFGQSSPSARYQTLDFSENKLSVSCVRQQTCPIVMHRQKFR